MLTLYYSFLYHHCRMWDYLFLETFSQLHKIIECRAPPGGGRRGILSMRKMYIFMRVVVT